MKYVLILSIFIFLCAFSPVKPVVNSPVHTSGILSSVEEVVTALRCDPIDGALFDLDATCTESYSGSGQTWSNIVADTDYDFYLGVDGTADGITDPVFTGSADSEDAYFLLNGNNDLFTQIDSTLGTMLQKCHRSDSDPCWVAAVYQSQDITNNYGIMGNGATAGLKGWRWDRLTSNLTFGVNSDTNQSNDSGVATGQGIEHIIIMTWDPSLATNGACVWVNSTTKTCFNHNMGTNTTDVTSAFTLADSALGNMRNLFRIYAFSGGQAFLDDADALAIMEKYQTRHTEGRYSFLP